MVWSLSKKDCLFSDAFYTSILAFFNPKFYQMKKNLLLFVALFVFTIGSSQTFIDNFITYNVTSTNPNTVRTTSYNTAGGVTVTVPGTVSNGGVTYSVTEIGAGSFANKQ